jgi:hypothetical protein
MNYVGIDIHKRYSVLVAIDERGYAEISLREHTFREKRRGNVKKFCASDFTGRGCAPGFAIAFMH